MDSSSSPLSFLLLKYIDFQEVKNKQLSQKKLLHTCFLEINMVKV